MTISQELTKLNTNMQNAYTAVSNKGGTLPDSQNMDNLATAINSISGGSIPVINSLNVTPTTSTQTITAPSGVDGYSPVNVSAVTSSIDSNIKAGNIKDGISILGITGTYTGSGIIPSGTYNITLNGTYNITNYANVYVNVPTTITGYTELPPYQVSNNGVASRRSGTLTGNEFSNITSIDSYGLYYAFYRCSGLTGQLNLSSLTSVGSYGLSYAFRGCSGLTSIDLSSLKSVGSYGLSYAFRDCSGLTSIDLSSLTTISNNGLSDVFYDCTGLTGNLNLSSLTSVGNYGLDSAFINCRGLTSINLSSLISAGDRGLYYAFQDCRGLTRVDLSSLTSVGSSGLSSAFYYCISLTSVNLLSLESIDDSGLYYAFQRCSSLTSVSLPSLTIVGSQGLYYAFYQCSGLTDVYFNALTTTSFGSYKNQFNNMLSSTGTSVTHTLHFPSNLESTISGLTGYPTFGGTSGYVVCAFDLPATS